MRVAVGVLGGAVLGLVGGGAITAIDASVPYLVAVALDLAVLLACLLGAIYLCDFVEAV